MRDMAALQQALRDRYGDEDGELICSGNSLRPLTSYWRGSGQGKTAEGLG